MLFPFDTFLETERAEVGDQADLPAQEVPRDSSNDSRSTLLYSSNSPIPFPSSPMHSFTASPDGISSLPIAINVSLNSNIMTHNPTTYSPSTPILSSILTSRSFQTHPSRRLFTAPRATLPGRRRASRGRRRQVTSTASCQTSPIPSYYWPGFQPNRVFLGGPSTDGALDLAPMPRAYNHFPTSLPLDPFHYDFFSVLKAASPIVTFHCPSPFTQKNFSFIYSIHFPHGEEAKPLLVTGIHRLVSLFSLYLIFSLFFLHSNPF